MLMQSFIGWCMPVSKVTSGPLCVWETHLKLSYQSLAESSRITPAPPLGVPFESHINLDQSLPHSDMHSPVPLIPAVFI